MAQVIGYVKDLQGEFIVLDSKGQERNLSVGDSIFLDDEIVGDGQIGSKITLFIEQGQQDIVLMGNDPLLMDNDFLKTGLNENIKESNQQEQDEDEDEKKDSEEQHSQFSIRDAGEIDLETNLAKKKETQNQKSHFNDRNADETDLNTGLAKKVQTQKQEDRFNDRNADETDFSSNLFNGNFDQPIKSLVPTPPPYKIVPAPLVIHNALVEEGSHAIFNVSLYSTSEVPYKITFKTETTLSAEPEDIVASIIVKDSKDRIIDENSDGTYTVPVGETGLKVLVPTIDDEIYEKAEEFKLIGQTEFMDKPVSGKGTIVDDGTEPDGDDPDGDLPPAERVDDDRPQMLIEDVTVEEGSNAVFNVTLSNKAEIDYKVTFTTEDITTEQEDTKKIFIVKDSQNKIIDLNSDGTYTVTAGESSLKVYVQTIDDEELEISEEFVLHGKTEFMNESVSGKGTIIDDGSAPDGDDPDNISDDDRKIEINNITVEEGSNAIFTVTLPNSTEEYKITFKPITNLSAEVEDIGSPIVVKDSQDIEIVLNSDGTYTIPAGETSLKVLVPTVDDEIYEKSEQFQLTGQTEFMSSPVIGIGTIIDDGSEQDGDDPDGDLPPAKRVDDDRPTMTIKDIRVEEGSNAIFDVSLSNRADQEYTVRFNTTTNLTAEAGDIGSPIVVKDSKGTVITQNNNGSYTVPVGETNLQVLVPTIDDEEFEVSEDFTLSGKTEFMSTTTTAIGSIIDDGSQPDGDDPDNIPDDDTPKPIENIIFESDMTLDNYGQISEGTSIEGNIFEGSEKPADDIGLKNFTIENGTTVKADNQITVTTKENNILVINTDSSSDKFGDFTYTLNHNMYHIGAVDINNTENITTMYKDEFSNGTDGWENSKANGNATTKDGKLIIEDQQYITKTFTGIAGQEVLVEFDFQSNEKWSGDYFKYYINGGNTNAIKHSANETEHFKFLANFDENGKLEMVLRTDGDAVGETSIIDNFTIKVPFLDRVTDNFTYTLSNDATVDFDIIIKDDNPIIDNLSVDIVVGSSISTNLLLVLDRSSSMNSKFDNKQYMSWMTESLTNMVKKYNDLGEVNIKIVGFWGATDDKGTTIDSENNKYDHDGYSYTDWLSVDDALSYLKYDPNLDDKGNSDAGQIFAYDGTWYDKGIDAAQDFYEKNTDGTIGLEPERDGQQTIAYFLTDGEPTSGHAEQSMIDDWNDFVREKVDMSIAVGFKDLDDPSILNKLTSHGDAMIVQTVTDLNAVLTHSVLDTQGSFSTFSDETTRISFGADGGHLLTLEYEGTVLTYDSSNIRQIAHLKHGDLEVDFSTGFYVYKPIDLVDIQETITVELIDSDGDVDPAEVVLNISYINSIVYDATSSNNDAKSEGVGTLIFAENHDSEDIDFSKIDSNKIINFEGINLNTDKGGVNGTHELTKITLSDIVDLTDNRNDLTIFGDSNDKVELLDTGDDSWSKSSSTITENGHIFDIFTNSGDSSVEVRVETAINDNMI